MLYHGSKAGAFDLKTIVLESVEGMRRAGNIINYLPSKAFVRCCSCFRR